MKGCAHTLMVLRLKELKKLILQEKNYWSFFYTNLQFGNHSCSNCKSQTHHRKVMDSGGTKEKPVRREPIETFTSEDTFVFAVSWFLITVKLKRKFFQNTHWTCIWWTNLYVCQMVLSQIRPEEKILSVEDLKKQKNVRFSPKTLCFKGCYLSSRKNFSYRRVHIFVVFVSIFFISSRCLWLITS